MSTNLAVGQIVEFVGRTEWKIEGFDKTSGKVVLSQKLQKAVCLDEFKRLNGNSIPVRSSLPIADSSAKYKLQHSGRDAVKSWHFAGCQRSSKEGDPVMYVFTQTNQLSVPAETLEKGRFAQAVT